MRLITLLLLAALLCLSACGDDSPGDTADATSDAVADQVDDAELGPLLVANPTHIEMIEISQSGEGVEITSPLTELVNLTVTMSVDNYIICTFGIDRLADDPFATTLDPGEVEHSNCSLQPGYEATGVRGCEMEIPTPLEDGCAWSTDPAERPVAYCGHVRVELSDPPPESTGACLYIPVFAEPYRSE